MAEAKLTIRTDEDWMALVAYRFALKLIVEEFGGEGWRENPAAEIARRALKQFPRKP